MFSQIKKRDGRTVDFDAEKIVSAIAKAGKGTSEFDVKTAKTLMLKVLSLADNLWADSIPGVEDIQDLVEEVLLNSSYKKTAKAYIIYRDQHKKIREIVSKGNINIVDSYLSRLDWQVKENSNMSYSLQGLNNYISSEISKVYWLNKIYPENIKKAHSEGSLHIHDLNLISVYCVGWDLQDLLSQGFRGVEGKIESKPPRHFRSALGQIVNFFYTLQGEAAGAQAFSSFDTLLAPFIAYDNLKYKDVKQALQEFVFNINVPTRVGFQTPFTNITMDLKVPSTLRDMPIVIGGEMQETTYSDYQKEMNMLNQAFLEVMVEGDAKGRVFTFPIPTYNITKDFDWDDDNYDKIWEITARYGIPYFSNFINSSMNPEDARSMCCRLRLDTSQLESRGGGLFGANPLTGSIGVVTINLARIGYLSQDETEFMILLKEQMNLARESLEIKRKVLERLTDSNLYPYTTYYLRNIKERHGEYWKNHFSTIGLVGMNEASLNLTGDSLGSEEGMSFAERVMDVMRAEILEFQKKTNNHYNLEATPAEGTSYRLAKMDKKMFPDIIVANDDQFNKEQAQPYYTNSTQLPVNYSEDVFEVLDLQDNLQTKYTGGTVLHFFTGEKNLDKDSVKMMVKKVCEGYRLPYFTITPTFSICPSHGYLAGEESCCPHCQKECEIYSRVVGYIRPVKQWNDGKIAEYGNRSSFKITNRVTQD